MVEYCWGCAKMWYRNQPINMKKRKSNFLNTVKQATSKDVLTLERSRKFARRQRAYMQAYKFIADA